MGPMLVLQTLNGLQFGILLFLLAAGMTLIFGIMNFVNLAHGSLYMLGAYIGATVSNATGWFPLGVLAAIPAAGLTGLLLERTVLRRLYRRPHLDQLLVTYGLLLIFNELAGSLWGLSPYYSDMPDSLADSLDVFGMGYPAYRLLIVAVGLAVASGCYLLVHATRFGMHLRAIATDPQMTQSLGIDVGRLNAAIFTLGAAMAGLAGVLAAPIVSVEPGMGEKILISAVVVIIIGGVGSVRGAFFAAMIVGLTDTIGRVFLPPLLERFLVATAADAAGPALAAVSVYVLMAVVLACRPEGLFAVRGR